MTPGTLVALQDSLAVVSIRRSSWSRQECLVKTEFTVLLRREQVVTIERSRPDKSIGSFESFGSLKSSYCEPCEYPCECDGCIALPQNINISSAPPNR